MHGSLPGLAAGRFGVIMFFSACRLPSFAPEDPPSHASENQITTGAAFWRNRKWFLFKPVGMNIPVDPLT